MKNCFPNSCQPRFLAGIIFILPVILVLSGSTQRVSAQGLTTVDDWLDQGWHNYNSGDLDEAFKTFLQAVELFPGNAGAHLALGEIYLEMGITDRGREQLLICLVLDDFSATGARAHYSYAKSIREEDPSLALQHLERALELGGSTYLQLETAHQMRFCNLLTTMTERVEHEDVIFHYPLYLMSEADAQNLVSTAAESFFRVKAFTICNFSEPVHFFIYPSERALRAEVRVEEDDWDPAHREFHVVCTPNLDFMKPAAWQIRYDLQQQLNRHAGVDWAVNALPTAVLGRVRTNFHPNQISGLPGSIDCNDAVIALCEAGINVKLNYLISSEYDDLINSDVADAELGSFLRWIKNNFDIHILQEVITQPNLQEIFNLDIEELEEEWLSDIRESGSLISDPETAEIWAESLPASPLAGNPELPVQILKDGLRMYLSGETASGYREIHRAIDVDPGLGLGYYVLGWVEAGEGDWDDARRHLETAVLLMVNPVEIAWCHALLSPIYLNDADWNSTRASLNIVIAGIDSAEIQSWASEMLVVVNHIETIRPDVNLGSGSVEFGLMNSFFSEWNVSANSSSGVWTFISELMEPDRAGELEGYYTILKDEYPGIIFNHAVQRVSVLGSAYYVELRVQARIPGLVRNLSPLYQPLIRGGLLRYFQIMPTEDGWRVVDWEDGWFPLGEGLSVNTSVFQ